MKTISGILILWAFCLFPAPVFAQTVSMTFLPYPYFKDAGTPLMLDGKWNLVFYFRRTCNTRRS